MRYKLTSFEEVSSPQGTGDLSIPSDHPGLMELSSEVSVTVRRDCLLYFQYEITGTSQSLSRLRNVYTTKDSLLHEWKGEGLLDSGPISTAASEPTSVPISIASESTEDLWKGNCWEVFLKSPQSTKYWEWNFALSGNKDQSSVVGGDGLWNFYPMTNYRTLDQSFLSSSKNARKKSSFFSFFPQNWILHFHSEVLSGPVKDEDSALVGDRERSLNNEEFKISMKVDFGLDLRKMISYDELMESHLGLSVIWDRVFFAHQHSNGKPDFHDFKTMCIPVRDNQ